MANLSVVIPNFNHAATLPRALDALLPQLQPGDELIVVDDGSTDPSRDVIQRYADRHACIRPIPLTENVGTLAAFNHGIDAAQHPWIYGAGANDRCCDGFLDRVHAAIDAHPEAGLILAPVVCIDRSGRTLEISRVPAWTDDGFRTPNQYLREHLDTDPPAASLSAATVYRREALLAVGGFRQDLSFAADLFAARAIGLQRGVVYLAKPGAQWTYDPQGYSPRLSADPQCTESVGHALLNTMRSPPFDRCFPADHVARWATRWHLEMAGGLDHVRDTLVANRLRDVRRAYAALGQDGRWFDRLLSAALRGMLGFKDRRQAARETKIEKPAGAAAPPSEALPRGAHP